MKHNLIKTKFISFILALFFVAMASNSYALDIGGTVPIEVDTIAELRMHPGGLTSNKTAIVNGYWVLGDAGASNPDYVWVESATPGLYTDNGGSVITTGGDDSDAWIWPDLTETRASWWGADATGVNDAQPFCETALEFVDTLRFGAGIFRFANTLYVHGIGKRIIGSGVGDTTINVEPGIVGIVMGNSPSPATFDTNHIQSISDLKIVGGTFPIQFGSDNSPTSFLGQAMRLELTGGSEGGLSCNGAQGATFQDINIHNNKHGIVFPVSVTRSTASKFTRIRSFLNTENGLYGESMAGIRFVNCNFESNGKEGVVLQKIDGVEITNVIFEACWFEANLTGGAVNTASINVLPGATSAASDIKFYDIEFNSVSNPGSTLGTNRHIIVAAEVAFFTNNRFLGMAVPVDPARANMSGMVIGSAVDQFTTPRNLTFLSVDITTAAGNLKATNGVVETSGDTTDHNKLFNSTSDDGGTVVEIKSSSTINAVQFNNFDMGADASRTGMRWDLSAVANTRMWVDDLGRLRVSPANPTAQDSGVVVGNQTFTGAHIYQSDREYLLGSAVMLINRKLELCSTLMDKRCIGIYAGKGSLAYDSFGKSEDPGHFVISTGDTVFEHDQIKINSMLVCDEGGPIEVGDLLCTSSLPGFLMKQPDDLQHGYTVAQAQEAAIFIDGNAEVYGYILK
jgi:hypothetical protein